MLYWAEGYKAGRTVDFVNSDPRMVKIFVDCLRIIYQVTESRFSVQLYCYVNQEPNNLIDFWSELTGIPKKQFIKPYVRKDFKSEKSGKMLKGVVHIRYNDLRLYQQIMQDIGKISTGLLAGIV